MASGKRFQSTRPRRARRFLGLVPSGRGGFNPRAREGRDVGLRREQGRPRVSIHAPAKGATVTGNDSATAISQFQSTRPRRARLKYGSLRNSSSCFNPRAREGRDAARYRQQCGSGEVSIHAPAKGATKGFRPDVQPRYGFQSTRPRRARRGVQAAHRRGEGFNPRAREGRDTKDCTLARTPKRFQSTRPRRARPSLRTSFFSIERSFNPRAREGRDLYQSLRPATFKCFNPRAREGRDHAASFHR